MDAPTLEIASDLMRNRSYALFDRSVTNENSECFLLVGLHGPRGFAK